MGIDSTTAWRRGQRAAQGKEPVITRPATIHDDSPLATAKANLRELERRLPTVEASYDRCQDAYFDAETELDRLKERITQRRAELSALAGDSSGVQR